MDAQAKAVLGAVAEVLKEQLGPLQERISHLESGAGKGATRLELEGMNRKIKQGVHEERLALHEMQKGGGIDAARRFAEIIKKGPPPGLTLAERQKWGLRMSAHYKSLLGPLCDPLPTTLRRAVVRLGPPRHVAVRF